MVHYGRNTQSKYGIVNYKKSNLNSIAQKEHILNSNNEYEPQQCIKKIFQLNVMIHVPDFCLYLN